ncbi:MAG: hypothetical protein ACE5OZ_14220 [Candidatus Heimdallarchaeota archaeon]
MTSLEIPFFLKPLFWDTLIENIRLAFHQRYIIERILEYGDDQAIKWLKNTFTASEIALIIRTSRQISHKTANLWALVLEIPREEIACLKAPSMRTLGKFSDS